VVTRYSRKPFFRAEFKYELSALFVAFDAFHVLFAIAGLPFGVCQWSLCFICHGTRFPIRYARNIMLVTKLNQHKSRRRSTAVATAKRGRRALPVSIAYRGNQPHGADRCGQIAKVGGSLEEIFGASQRLFHSVNVPSSAPETRAFGR
jgi:hypothetical protein